MERKCEVTVQIGGYRKNREEEIMRACSVEWYFREDDFFYVPIKGMRRKLLEASSLGMLHDGIEIQEVIERIERAVWRANGRLCHVEVKARLLIEGLFLDSDTNEENELMEMAA